MIQISNQVLAALNMAQVDGNALVLRGQLDRKLYVETNKVLEAIGGKWNKKAKAHLFDDPVADVLDPILLTGVYTSTKRDFQQFDTPAHIAALVVDRAMIQPGDTVLEPSAGIGRLAEAVIHAGGVVDCMEIDPKRVKTLRSIHGIRDVTEGDFLKEIPPSDQRGAYKRIVMNPPFTKGQDVDHVRQAYEWLRPGGILVAIMSPGFIFRNDSKYATFRAWGESLNFIVEELPEGAFKDSGTNVNTVVVTLTKPQVS